MHKHAQLAAIALVFGLVGGTLGRLVLPAAQAADPKQSKTLTAEEFRLVDPSGKTTAQLVNSKDGGPCLFLFDKQGHARLEVGIYPDGLPFVILQDDKNNATGLFRGVGEKNSPVLVLKADGRDRMIMGLQFEKPEQEPFIEAYNSKGEKHEVYGKR